MSRNYLDQVGLQHVFGGCLGCYLMQEGTWMWVAPQVNCETGEAVKTAVSSSLANALLAALTARGRESPAI